MIATYISLFGLLLAQYTENGGIFLFFPILIALVICITGRSLGNACKNPVSKNLINNYYRFKQYAAR